MARLLLFDTIFRLLAAGQLILIALVIGRARAPWAIRATTVGLLLCVAAYLANVAPILHVPRSNLWPVIQLGSQSTPLFLWLFAQQLFERKVDRRVAIGAVLLILASWVTFVVTRYAYGYMTPAAQIADVAMHLTALLLAVHAMAIAIAERNNDLIEKRRVFRTGFVVAVGLQTIGIVVVETVYGYMSTHMGLMLLQSSTSLIAVMAFGAMLMSGNAELLFDPSAAPPPRPSLSPAEHVLKIKLDAAMAAGEHRSPGLTIGALADKLGTPEHRLRALINQRLGYRNFSDFLNTHRIAEARAWLADPARVDLPVLTIAMDLGYGSLAPFNRAFREATGQTPSDFRRGAILPDSEKG